MKEEDREHKRMSLNVKVAWKQIKKDMKSRDSKSMQTCTKKKVKRLCNIKKETARTKILQTVLGFMILFFEKEGNQSYAIKLMQSTPRQVNLRCKKM